MLQAPAGQRHIQFLEIFVRHLAQDFNLLVGNQDHQVNEAILVSIVKDHGRRIGFELLAELLDPGLAVGGARDQRALAVLIDDHRQDRLRPGAQLADRQHQRFALHRDQGRERQPLFLVQMGDAHLALITAEQEDFHPAISVPVCRRQIADAGQGRKSLGRRQRAIWLLQIE